jgi:hypothetical protein
MSCIPNIKKDLKILYSDTDSFIHEIKTDDWYADMRDMKDHFDTSDYPTTHANYSVTNKKVLGKMKDELNGAILKEYVGLRSKMYALFFSNNFIKKAKGIKKGAIERTISFDDYKTCLFNDVQIRTTFNLIRSRKHIIHSIEQNKLALDSNCDKRQLLPDGINTLPYGFVSLVNDDVMMAECNLFQ